MESLKTRSIGSFVAEDYRTATVFQKYGIDFCCKGGKSISEVCESKKISADDLLANLDAATSQSTNQNTNYQSWPLDFLADYIVNKHHQYVEQTTPTLKQFLHKLCKVHGANHPELFKISDEFNASAEELAMHMKKEELVLFPYIKNMVSAASKNEPKEIPAFGTVQNPIKMMMDEHDVEGERFRKIAQLSDNYNSPADGCTTYRVAFALLKEFEEDLHLHIHLENNILFPKAIEMEKQLSVVNS